MQINLPTNNRWNHARIVVAAILLIAAISKSFNVVEILAGNGLLSTEPLLFASIAFEAAAATYLLIGNRYWSWMLSIVTFSVFAFSSLYALATGQECNCISSRIGPGLMLSLDLFVVAVTLICRPKPGSPVARNLLQHASFCLAVGSIFVGAAAWRHQGVYQSESESVEFLLADMLIGKPWPLDSSMHSALNSVLKFGYSASRC